MSRRLPLSSLLPSVVSCFALGCYSASSPIDGGAITADATRPDAPLPRDAGPPLGDGDPSTCETAPRLGLDARVEVNEVAAASPPDTSCWSGGTSVRSYYALEIPPGVGVEIRTEGTEAPVPGLFDRCAPGGERCRSFAASGFFSPGETRYDIYYGNHEAVPVQLTLSLWWVSETPQPFVITTRSVPVAEHGRCEDARPLGENELVPPSERGGTYENWDCVHPPESLFYDITIPAGHVAIPLAGAQSPSARLGCGCEPGSASPDPLVNLGDEPQPIVIEARPSEAVGVRFAPLPDSATCGAATLPIDGVDRALDVFPRLISGFDFCAYNDAHHFTLEIPAGAEVEVSALLDTPYPTMGVRDTCEELDCTREGLERSADRRMSLVLRNPTDAPVLRYVTFGSEGPAEGPLTGEVRARVLP